MPVTEAYPTMHVPSSGWGRSRAPMASRYQLGRLRKCSSSLPPTRGTATAIQRRVQLSCVPWSRPSASFSLCAIASRSERHAPWTTLRDCATGQSYTKSPSLCPTRRRVAGRANTKLPHVEQTTGGKDSTCRGRGLSAQSTWRHAHSPVCPERSTINVSVFCSPHTHSASSFSQHTDSQRSMPFRRPHARMNLSRSSPRRVATPSPVFASDRGRRLCGGCSGLPCQVIQTEERPTFATFRLFQHRRILVNCSDGWEIPAAHLLHQRTRTRQRHGLIASRRYTSGIRPSARC